MVIARNAGARLPRLLRSVRPYVGRMLVMDTGSTDNTTDLAQAEGAQVAHFRWCDDFAAARNAALEVAGADWHVVLDADEWLLSGGESLQALTDQAPCFVGSVQLLNHTDEAQQSLAHDRISRVLPGHLRYAGRVHEQPQHALPVRALPVHIGHDGYRAADLAAKRGRNARLLQLALAETPGDAYLWYQLGKDAAIYDDHPAAETAFAQAAALPHAAPWWLDLVPRRLYTLKCLGWHEAAMNLASEELNVCGISPDFWFALGDVVLDTAAEHPDRAMQLLPLAEDCWRRCLDLGERPDLPGAVAGRGSHLAAHNLAVVLDGTGRSDEAQAVRQAHPAPL